MKNGDTLHHRTFTNPCGWEEKADPLRSTSPGQGGRNCLPLYLAKCCLVAARPGVPEGTCGCFAPGLQGWSIAEGTAQGIIRRGPQTECQLTWEHLTWGSYFTSLNLDSLICKTELILVLPHRDIVRMDEDTVCKHLAQSLTHRKWYKKNSYCDDGELTLTIILWSGWGMSGCVQFTNEATETKGG